MRPFKLGVVAFGVLVPLSAFAGHGRGGGGSGGGGGGPLHSVSSGLGGAARAGGATGSSTTIVERNDRTYVERDEAPVSGSTVIVHRRRARPEPPRLPAHFEGYAGAQKTVDSDGGFTAELSIVDDWLRLGGSVTRYYEAQSQMPALTLTMPSITLGVRVDDAKGTNIYVIGGLVGAKTAHDPVMDSSFVGVIGGLRVESPINTLASLVGEANLMQFGQGVRATSARVGVRVGPVQASVRVLDFNVGPPLYGPELGVGF
ncbi:MAG: hypothetical protein IPQ07_38930 [Myxococcales bacterium]|nr:hypothetical protein [Myxococcales bacterium]